MPCFVELFNMFVEDLPFPRQKQRSELETGNRAVEWGGRDWKEKLLPGCTIN